MPVIKSITIGSCSTDGGGGGSGSGLSDRLKEEYYDELGTGLVIWTKNSGELPMDLENKFDVLTQGNLLTYMEQYTVTPFNTPTTSLITIINPVPETYYTMIAYL